MAEPRSLLLDLSTLFDALPQAQLVEVSRRAAFGGLQSVCRRELGGQKLENVVAALFPGFPRERVIRVARAISLNAVRNGCWKSVMQLPGQWKVAIRCPDRAATEALRAHQGPVILAFWHFGPVNMLAIGLKRLGVPASIISRATPSRWTKDVASDDMKLLSVADNSPAPGVTTVRQALDQLKKGGNVAIAVDGSAGKQTITLPFLGRQFPVSRGVAGLARLTGATIIPCSMEWGRTDWSMAIRIFDPIPQPAAPPENTAAYEQAVLATVVRCFETYGRSHPGQFKIDQLAMIVKAPQFVA